MTTPQGPRTIYLACKPLDSLPKQTYSSEGSSDSSLRFLSHWLIIVSFENAYGNGTYQLFELFNENKKILVKPKDGLGEYTGKWTPYMMQPNGFPPRGVGKTSMTPEQIANAVREVEKHTPEHYDVSSNNCQTFASDLIRKIALSSPPSRLWLIVVEGQAALHVSPDPTERYPDFPDSLREAALAAPAVSEVYQFDATTESDSNNLFVKAAQIADTIYKGVKTEHFHPKSETAVFIAVKKLKGGFYVGYDAKGPHIKQLLLWDVVGSMTKEGVTDLPFAIELAADS